MAVSLGNDQNVLLWAIAAFTALNAFFNCFVILAHPAFSTGSNVESEGAADGSVNGTDKLSATSDPFSKGHSKTAEDHIAAYIVSHPELASKALEGAFNVVVASEGGVGSSSPAIAALASNPGAGAAVGAAGAAIVTTAAQNPETAASLVASGRAARVAMAAKGQHSGVAVRSMFSGWGGGSSNTAGNSKDQPSHGRRESHSPSQKLQQQQGGGSNGSSPLKPIETTTSIASNPFSAASASYGASAHNSSGVGAGGGGSHDATGHAAAGAGASMPPPQPPPASARAFGLPLFTINETHQHPDSGSNPYSNGSNPSANGPQQHPHASAGQNQAATAAVTAGASSVNRPTPPGSPYRKASFRWPGGHRPTFVDDWGEGRNPFE